MDRSECLQGVVDVAQDVFSRRLEDTSQQFAKVDIPEWDSLANLMVIMGVEQKFNLRFSAQQAQQFQSLREIADHVHQARASA